MNILVTGANGQLAQTIKEIVNDGNSGVLDVFTFVGREDLDICDELAVEDYFASSIIDVVINCAAYTKVDLAEEERDEAFDVNLNAVKYLAMAAESCGAEFYHISTDFVFDGKSCSHYKESDITNPLSVYGKTKLEGEKIAMEYCSKAKVIRTSWLYSKYGNNFVKTIIRLASERKELTIVADQVGTPTYAENLAKAILKMICSDNKHFGELYHYSDGGECSWCDFAREIVKLKAFDCNVKAITSDEYPQKAIRPKYSVLNKDKIIKDYGVEIIDWRESLRKLIMNINYEL